jgi:hypothetical protein
MSIHFNSTSVLKQPLCIKTSRCINTEHSLLRYYTATLSVAGFSPRRPGIAHSAVHVELTVNKLAMRQVSRSLRFSSVSIIPQLLHFHSCIKWEMENGPAKGPGLTMPIRPSVCPYDSTREPVDGSTWNPVWTFCYRKLPNIDTFNFLQSIIPTQRKNERTCQVRATTGPVDIRPFSYIGQKILEKTLDFGTVVICTLWNNLAVVWYNTKFKFVVYLTTLSTTHTVAWNDRLIKKNNGKRYANKLSWPDLNTIPTYARRNGEKPVKSRAE